MNAAEFDVLVDSLDETTPDVAIGILNTLPILNAEQFEHLASMVETPDELLALFNGNLAAGRKYHAARAEIKKQHEAYRRMITPNVEAAEAEALHEAINSAGSESQAADMLRAAPPAVYARVADRLAQSAWTVDDFERDYLYLVNKEPTK